jgi:DNA-binding transcriptional LysR family regulator
MLTPKVTEVRRGCAHGTTLPAATAEARSRQGTERGATPPAPARDGVRHADVAPRRARAATERPTMRLRIGYPADSLPGSVLRALREVAASVPSVRVELEPGPATRLIEGVRSGRLEAVVTSLPTPASGLRVTPLEEQRPVAVLPTGPHAAGSVITLEQLAQQRVVVLPREVNPAFHDAVTAMYESAGLSPTFVEVAEPSVEQVLLAVAMGAGIGLLPESATERYAMPGVRFVPLEGAQPAFRSAVLTDPDARSLATIAFLRALAQARRGGAAVSGPVVDIAAYGRARRRRMSKLSVAG